MNGKSGWSKSEWIPFITFVSIMFGTFWFVDTKQAYYSRENNIPVITVTYNNPWGTKKYYYSEQFDKYIDPKYGGVLRPQQVDTIEGIIHNYEGRDMHLELK